MIQRGQLHPFSITGLRSKVVFEHEVAALQNDAYAKALADTNDGDEAA
jgi:hypothetical protein